MQPVGPLMWEHRTIEKAVALMETVLARMRTTRILEVRFLELSADFIRTYADRTHHGKEEDILFRELSRKSLSPEHAIIMEELVAEHVRGRALTSQVVAGVELYAVDASAGLESVTEALEQLCELYPGHIAKEDERFFLPVMKYFERAEMDAMLREFAEFDQQLIHEKYTARVNEMEKAAGV